MPNRYALSRGGPREAAVLENIRQGHSQRAACAAAGVGESSFYRHIERSPAFARDVELALADAERRLVTIVLDAAATDAKHAEWLLARRWPEHYGDRQQVDMAAKFEGQYDHTVIALAQRYMGLSPAETESEIKALDWVVPVTHQPGAVVGQITTAETDSIMGGEGETARAFPTQQYTGGGAAALPPPTHQPASADEAADTPDNEAEVLNRTNGIDQPPLRPVVVPPPSSCPHCRGHVPGRHETQCPVFEADGRLKAPLHPFAIGGDPR
jgi:hypothetical protein